MKRQPILYTGEFFQEFESVHACARYFGIPAKNMVDRIKSGKYQDFILSYTKENENTFDPIKFI